MGQWSKRKSIHTNLRNLEMTKLFAIILGAFLIGSCTSSQPTVCQIAYETHISVVNHTMDTIHIEVNAKPGFEILNQSLTHEINLAPEDSVLVKTIGWAETVISPTKALIFSSSENPDLADLNIEENWIYHRKSTEQHYYIYTFK